jgi:hypothetical protein
MNEYAKSKFASPPLQMEKIHFAFEVKQKTIKNGKTK